MRTELKKSIINYIFENERVFGLNQAVTQHFRAYIFDSEGSFLIGGEEVSKFIDEAIKLIENN